MAEFIVGYLFVFITGLIAGGVFVFVLHDTLVEAVRRHRRTQE